MKRRYSIYIVVFIIISPVMSMGRGRLMGFSSGVLLVSLSLGAEYYSACKNRGQYPPLIRK